jgi:hypothetical protein
MGGSGRPIPKAADRTGPRCASAPLR